MLVEFLFDREAPSLCPRRCDVALLDVDGDRLLSASHVLTVIGHS